MAGYEFAYDLGSRIDSINSFIDGLSDFDYDNTNQLTGADHTGQTDETYTYDENGNRTMSGYSTGANNRLLSDGTYNYTYDDEGNRLTKTKISTGEKEEYAWDHRNRLTGVTFKNSSGTVLKTVLHSYDIFNRWIRRTVDPDGPGSAAAVDSFFSHEGGQIALQFDTDGDLTHRYLWGPAIDQILADETVTSLLSAGEVLWPLTDHLGTPRDLAEYDSSTDETTIANHRVFDSFGVIVSETNSSVTTIVGFTGRPFDDSTGLNNHWHRWFEFRVWLNEDPIGFAGHSSNLYGYVNNSPNAYIDSTGFVEEFPLSRKDIEAQYGWGKRPTYSLYPDYSGGWTDRMDQTPYTRERGRLMGQIFGSFITDTTCSLTPGISDYRDGYEFGSGKDMLTGEQIPWYWRGLTGIGIFLPVFGMAFFRRALSMSDYVVDAGKTTGKVYDVGSAAELRRTPVKGTEVNHAPQSRQAESLLGDFDPKNKVGIEPAIRLPCSEHDAVSAAQRSASAPASARDLLAEEIRRLRNNTGAPNDALKRLIEESKKKHPRDYLKLNGIYE